MKRRRSPAQSQKSKPQTSASSGQFRIIGGQWRSRKLAFPAVDGLRPTPDRVRETLFNWLQEPVERAQVLDLFCGSGAHGLEALSRGAQSATFVDASAQAARAISEHLSLLKAEGATITGQLPNALQQLSGVYDLVFIDPPYAKAALIGECIEYLMQHNRLSEQAWVYAELSADDPTPAIPAGFTLHRHKRFGQVQSCLMIRSAEEA